MNAIVINSSPLKDHGNTYIIQSKFISGLRDAGVEVEEIFLKDMKINPCLGKLICWIKTPGKCCQNDDMESLLEKLKDAELWVFSTPLYWDGVTGPMKVLFDRLLPLIVPEISIVDGHCRHALQTGVKSGKIVLISSCGFWEPDNFEPLVVHLKAVSKNIHREFAGALLRPHGALIKYWVKTGNKLDNVLESTYQAALDLVKEGKIQPDLLDEVSKELISMDEYEKMINENFKRLSNGN